MNFTLLATAVALAVIALGISDDSSLAFLAGLFWFCGAYRLSNGDWPRFH